MGGYPVSVKTILMSHRAVQQRVVLNLFRAVFPPMFCSVDVRLRCESNPNVGPRTRLLTEHDGCGAGDFRLFAGLSGRTRNTGSELGGHPIWVSQVARRISEASRQASSLDSMTSDRASWESGSSISRRAMMRLNHLRAALAASGACQWSMDAPLWWLEWL